MKPAERHNWIIDHMNSQYSWRVGGVDILCKEFVADYIDATDAPHHVQPYGAYGCKQLQRDFKNLYDAGVLRRVRIGIPYDMRGMGFPLWVWNYSLSASWVKIP